MRESLGKYCARTGRTDLLDQWDADANAPRSPLTISHGSKHKVWWKCGRGHRWQAAVYTRTSSNTSCPYCAGRQPYPGETDLATVYPHLAAQWHPAKNGDLRPQAVLPGSHKRVWWICDRGHQWEAEIKSRSAGCGCPVCANRVIGEDNSLAATHPELAAQWHPVKNGKLSPEKLAPGTKRRVWWRCEHGHEWQATITSRANGRGCPYCAGRVVSPGENDLASAYPILADQWHPTKNAPLLPSQVTPCSNRKVWWRCEKGHEFQAAVSARATHNSGCPYCSNRRVLPGYNDLETLEPAVAAQWHPTLNGALTARMVTAGSRKKVWWQCGLGHVWKSVIYSRAAGQRCGCPVCAGRARPQTRISTSVEAKITTI